jgi:hypothetical protein
MGGEGGEFNDPSPSPLENYTQHPRILSTCAPSPPPATLHGGGWSWGGGRISKELQLKGGDAQIKC